MQPLSDAKKNNVVDAKENEKREKEGEFYK